MSKCTYNQTQTIRNLMTNRRQIKMVQMKLDELRIENLSDLSFAEAKTLIARLIVQMHQWRIHS